MQQEFSRPNSAAGAARSRFATFQANVPLTEGGDS
jgi:hypothetical protein